MKYVVVYQSKSGNTRKIAEEIYNDIQTDEKEIIDIDEKIAYPDADVYFIGFGIHDGNCSMDMISYFENMPDVKYVLFVTCGYYPTEEYKSRLENQLKIWLPDSGEYLGMFLCQGNVERDRRNILYSKMPTRERQLKQMFEDGSGHPDDEDLLEALEFVQQVQKETHIY